LYHDNSIVKIIALFLLLNKPKRTHVEVSAL